MRFNYAYKIKNILSIYLILKDLETFEFNKNRSFISFYNNMQLKIFNLL